MQQIIFSNGSEYKATFTDSDKFVRLESRPHVWRPWRDCHRTMTQEEIDSMNHEIANGGATYEA